MSEYIIIRVRRLSAIFIVPLVVEFGFFLFLVITKKSSNVLNFHGLWYIAAAATVFVVTAYQLTQCYYAGNDSLWKILPYSKELLALIDMVIYVIGTSVFGIVYQLIQNAAAKHSFEWTTYVGEKLLSLFSLYLLILAACSLFKNIQYPSVGRTLIATTTGIVIALQVFLYFKINGKNITSFMIGISNVGDLKNLAYISGLPYVFFYVKQNQMLQLVNTSLELNGIISISCLILFLVSAKLRKLNYIDLVG